VQRGQPRCRSGSGSTATEPSGPWPGAKLDTPDHTHAILASSSLDPGTRAQGGGGERWANIVASGPSDRTAGWSVLHTAAWRLVLALVAHGCCVLLPCVYCVLGVGVAGCGCVLGGDLLRGLGVMTPGKPLVSDQRISGSAVDGAPTEEPRPDASNARSHNNPPQRAIGVSRALACYVRTPVVAHRRFNTCPGHPSCAGA
jgi:hypothetical protein